MPKIKNIFKARGVTIEIQTETAKEGHKAKVLSLEFTNTEATITDLVKASLAAQSALMLKASKAKRKAAGKATTKKGKGRGKREVIAVARAPRKGKMRQGDIFKDAPSDQITPESMDERFPDEHYGCQPEQAEQAPAPSTANSCVMG